MLDERIEKAIIEVGARVVILDPIQAYVGANINMNNANEVRNIMAQLGRVAEKYDCCHSVGRSYEQRERKQIFLSWTWFD